MQKKKVKVGFNWVSLCPVTMALPSPSFPSDLLIHKKVGIYNIHASQENLAICILSIDRHCYLSY